MQEHALAQAELARAGPELERTKGSKAGLEGACRPGADGTADCGEEGEQAAAALLLSWAMLG